MHFQIVLPGGYSLTPAAYLKSLKLAQANPTTKFKQSFCDPRGWTGGHTGAEIVGEWRDMLIRRWAAWAGKRGKGNRAAKRARAVADRHATCKWCGQPTGSAQRACCSLDCHRSYNG